MAILRKIRKERLIMESKKEGTRVRILHMEGEPHYDGREGTVTSVDDRGQIHGTWGGCAIVPETDEWRIL